MDTTINPATEAEVKWSNEGGFIQITVNGQRRLAAYATEALEQAAEERGVSLEELFEIRPDYLTPYHVLGSEAAWAKLLGVKLDE
jgi:hypothetical protein